MVHFRLVPFILCFPCFLSVLFVSSIRLPNSNEDKPTHGSVFGATERGSKVKFDPTRVTQLLWSPRVFLYKNFLSDEECDHIIELWKNIILRVDKGGYVAEQAWASAQANGKLEKSMVADTAFGKSIQSEERTSSGMYLKKAQDEIVAGIEERLAAWTFYPIENGEFIQILHYKNGEKYAPHFDFFHGMVSQLPGGQRVSTVLMYLSDVEKGGETVFPNAKGKFSQPKDDSWSECARKGYAVKPRKGDALLFFSLHLNATIDTDSLHGSCPVFEGEKWSATKWIHVTDFEKPMRRVIEDAKCVDANANCERWAKVGQCEKYPLYMVGNEQVKGKCRKSCNQCFLSMFPLREGKMICVIK